MRSLPLIAALSAAALLTACATPEQLEAQRRQQEYEQDYQTCVNYGAVPNTLAFSDCMQSQSKSRYQEQGYQRPYDPYDPYMAPPPPPYPYHRGYRY